MDRNQQPLTLVHGCDVISRKLRYMQTVTGFLYQFYPNLPHRPRPLPLFVVLLNCLPPLLLIASDLIGRTLLNHKKNQSESYKEISESVFITNVARTFVVYRLLVTVANVIILLAQHGSISNTFASANMYVTEREQTYFANQAFTFYLTKSLASTCAYLSIVSIYYFNSETSIGWKCLALLSIYMIFINRMVNNSPLVYVSYLGFALGKHVENFSTIYVDTMFDQFMKAIEKGDESETGDQARPLPFFDTHSSDNINGDGTEAEQSQNCSCCSSCCAPLCGLKRLIVRALITLNYFVRTTISRLNMRMYPELPEMKMTKLSTTTNIQISETMRTTNSHLIRVRLRRTQIMLSELRDLVSDINKTSSPIILFYVAYDTLLVMLVTTSSIEAKVYKSFDPIRLLPTITITLSLVANVVYLCTCFDETRSQLKLLINKLFDFIIMNQRIKTTGKRTPRFLSQIHATDSEVCPLPGSEDGAINETWSQFQYTRKLANTIQFTMGGILPVTRRLVLSILGHILSAVFISIEIMSIIDTLNMPHEAAGHHSKPVTNATSTQYDAHDLLHKT